MFQVLLSITNNSIKHQSLVYTQFNDQTVLFQTIKSSVSHLPGQSLNAIWPIDRTLIGATILSHSGLRTDGNERVLRILQNSSITGTSPSDCLVWYFGHSLSWGSYPSREIQSVYYADKSYWAAWIISVKNSY